MGVTDLATVLLVVGTPDLPMGSDVIAGRLTSLLLLHALQLAVMLWMSAGKPSRDMSAVLSEVLGHSLRSESALSAGGRRRRPRASG